MKQILKSVILCILILNIKPLSAQNSNDKQIPISITGFGKLQLGMDILNIPELIETKKSRKFKEIIADTTNLYSNGEFDKRVRIFELDKYELIENIIVNDVRLKFFKNKLYSIEIKDYKMDDLVKTKYGEGKLSFEEEEHTFQNGYGAKIIKTDKTYIHTWTVDKPTVTLYQTFLIWYNDQGEKLDLFYVILEDNINKSEIDRASQEVKDRINERAKSKKKLELKDF